MKKLITLILVGISLVACSKNTQNNNNGKPIYQQGKKVGEIGWSEVYEITIDGQTYIIVTHVDGIAITPKIKPSK